MNTNTLHDSRMVPSRSIPVPDTVSPEMQAIIAEPPDPAFNVAPATTAEWKTRVAEDARKREAILPEIREALGVSVEPMTIGDVKTFIVIPNSIPEKNDDRLLIHLHGGVRVLGPGEAGTGEAILMAGFAGFKVISVDYRMPPDFPFPAALDEVPVARMGIDYARSADRPACLTRWISRPFVERMPTRIDTTIDGLVLIEPEVHGDERGFLLETFRTDAWGALGVELEFVQENHSRSTSRGTLRGLHFQTDPGQAKLVRCLRGKIWDVAVDLRRDSPTFGRWEGHELDDELHRQLLIPVGFAHGFCVISEEAEVVYKMTAEYSPERERGVLWNDPAIGIEWPTTNPILSEKDATAPLLVDAAVD